MPTQRADRYVFPFPDETFDVIFATSVFTHSVPASARQYAREIARLLKSRSGRPLSLEGVGKGEGLATPLGR
jgi:hypothetical protein